MKNMVSIDFLDQYDEKEHNTLSNHRMKREFLIKFHTIYLTQMILTCFFCSLCFYETVREPFESNKATLAPFIISFPLGIVVGGFLSGCRTLCKLPIPFTILFILGNSSIIFIYFYLCILTETAGIISLLLLQIASSIGRLVYIINNKVYYNEYELYFFSLIFLLIFEPIIFLFWTHNLFAIIFMFAGVAAYNIYLAFDIYDILEVLDIYLSFDDYYLCALIHYLGPLYIFVRACDKENIYN